MIHQACRVAADYARQLALLESDAGLAECDVAVQYPYSTEVCACACRLSAQTVAEIAQKERAREELAARRREQAQRLGERAARMRQEKIEGKRQQVESMRRLLRQSVAARTLAEDGGSDDEAAGAQMQQLRVFGYETVEDLQAALEGEQRELNRMLGIEEAKVRPAARAPPAAARRRPTTRCWRSPTGS